VRVEILFALAGKKGAWIFQAGMSTPLLSEQLRQLLSRAEALAVFQRVNELLCADRARA
jgi:hypothetical protein